MAAAPKIQALLFLQNGAKYSSIEAETVEAPPDNVTIAPRGYSTTWKNFSQEDLQSNAIWNNDDKSQPDFKLTPLPYIQPKCPEQVDEKAWKGRTVFGNASFHMFLVPKAGEEYFKIPGTDTRLPLAGDAVIMKVSPRQDTTGRWQYERIDPSSRELLKQLMSFFEEVRNILNRAGFGKTRGYIE